MSLTIHAEPPVALDAGLIDGEPRETRSGGGASPTVEIALVHRGDTLTRLLDPPPLRAAATLTTSSATLTGIVQSVTIGERPSITLET